MVIARGGDHTPPAQQVEIAHIETDSFHKLKIITHVKAIEYNGIAFRIIWECRFCGIETEIAYHIICSCETLSHRRQSIFVTAKYINIYMYVYINLCLCVCLCVYVSRIGAHTVHPIAMKLSQVVENVPAVVLEIKNYTSWSTRFCLTGAHTVHPIAMKLSKVVVNMHAVLLEIKKAGVIDVALQEHTPFIQL